MRINMESVAERAGVALSTVSLALRDHPRVSPETRQLVLNAVQELGYVRGRPGRPRRLENAPVRHKRTNRVALVVIGLPSPVLYAPVYMDVLHGVEVALAQRGKTMVLRHIAPDTKESQLLSSKVDGVLLFGPPPDPKWTEQLRKMPCVQLMNVAQPGEPWDRVTYDNAKIGPLAADYVLGKGHRHCAVLANDYGSPSYFLRRRGLDFRDAVKAKGGTVAMVMENLLRLTPDVHGVDPQAMSRAVECLLKLEPRPTAVFTETDMLAQALYQALYQALNLRTTQPGRDLEVISCNNERPLLAHLDPPPTTIDIHAQRVGRRAVDQLLWRMQHPEEPPVTVVLDPTLVPSGRQPEPAAVA